MNETRKEEVARTLAFLEGTRDADLITCDAETGRPLFAHWFTRYTEDGYLVENQPLVRFLDEPTPETRQKEERVRIRHQLEEVGAMVDWKVDEMNRDNT